MVHGQAISDSAKVEISARVKDVMRAMVIDDWQRGALPTPEF
jgi:hypothetical protein